VSGGTNEGDLLILRTDGTAPFGDHGPTLAARITLAGQSDGEDIDIAQIEGVGTFTHDSSGLKLPIEDNPDLPYGRGLQIGAFGTYQNATDSGRLRVQTALATEMYEALTIYWPETHQQAALPSLDDTAIWQIKSIWHFQPNVWNGPGPTDYFAGFPIWYNSYGTRGAWSCGRTIASNSRPTSTFVGCPTGMFDPSRELPFAPGKPMWRNVPVYRQFWAKHGPDVTSGAGSDGMVRLVDSTEGEVFDRRFTDWGRWDGSGAPAPGVSRITIPGFVRGYNIPARAHLFYGDIYEAISIGPGAAARVEIGDNSDYESCHNLSVFNIESWSNTEVQARVRKGIFYTRSLSGLSLFVTDADNVTTYVGTFP
jgi:hypothetical protein